MRGNSHVAFLRDGAGVIQPCYLTLSNTLEKEFCIDCLEDALLIHGKPDIFNTDQGSQFTSLDFTGVLMREGITISMDGRGRALDNIFVERLWRNVKYENIYLKGYANMRELLLGLTEYFVFYNNERPHQSLGYRTPDEVYQSGQGGGARVIDKFKKVEEKSLAEVSDKYFSASGQRCSVACASIT